MQLTELAAALPFSAIIYDDSPKILLQDDKGKAMAAPSDPQAFFESLFDYLRQFDMQAWRACFSENAMFNINGETPASGRFSIDTLIEQVFPPTFALLDAEKSEFGRNLKVMCADDQRVTVMFEGKAETYGGERYDNRYMQLYEFDTEGCIAEVWEFYDTALADKVLFSEQSPEIDKEAFHY
jgi:ketosteroid isomerase-like protein